MKKMFLIAALAATIGCDKVNPVGPSAAPQPAPISPSAIQVGDPLAPDAGPPHDLTVSISGFLQDGQIAYLCSTQPRQYCAPDGATCQTEIDFYVQADRCPTPRIE